MEIIKQIVGHLYHNRFSKDPNDYLFRITSTVATRTKADLVKSILSRRTDFEPHVVQAIVDLTFECMVEYLLSGFAFQDDYFRYSPTVRGVFKGVTATVDPDEHKVVINVAPTAKLRKLLSEVVISIVGESHESSFIDYVVNEATGEAEDKMVPGANFRIIGKGIKVAPLEEAEIGVFLKNSTGTVTKITSRLVENSSSNILFIVPNLPDDDYTLSIVTKAINNTNSMLKEARTMEFSRPIIVGDHPAGGGGGGAGGGGGSGYE
jgi:hypothetical protein